MKVNKYNIHWQVVRFRAKDIRNVKQKLEYVMDWLRHNNSVENFERVKKWMQMSPYGFKEHAVKELYKDALLEIRTWTYNKKDKPNDYSLYDDFVLKMVYDDVSKRKYNFQYKQTPKDHDIFVLSLGTYLGLL